MHSIALLRSVAPEGASTTGVIGVRTLCQVDRTSTLCKDDPTTIGECGSFPFTAAARFVLVVSAVRQREQHRQTTRRRTNLLYPCEY